MSSPEISAALLPPPPPSASESHYKDKYEALLASYQALERVGVQEAKERFASYQDAAEARFEGGWVGGFADVDSG